MQNLSGRSAAHAARRLSNATGAATAPFSTKPLAVHLPAQQPVGPRVPRLPLSASTSARVSSVGLALAGKGADAAQARLREGWEKQRFHTALQHLLFGKMLASARQGRLNAAQFAVFRNFMLARLHLTDRTMVDAERVLNAVGADVFGLRPMTMGAAFTACLRESQAFRDYAKSVDALGNQHFISLASSGPLGSDPGGRGMTALLGEVCRALGCPMEEGSSATARRAQALQSLSNSVVSIAHADTILSDLDAFAAADDRLFDAVVAEMWQTDADPALHA